MDFLKGISAQLLPGVQELQRRDLLHRASVVFPIDDKESDIEEELTEDLLILNEQDENGMIYFSFFLHSNNQTCHTWKWGQGC